jgi:hypothetical protein
MVVNRFTNRFVTCFYPHQVSAVSPTTPSLNISHNTSMDIQDMEDTYVRQSPQKIIDQRREIVSYIRHIVEITGHQVSTFYKTVLGFQSDTSVSSSDMYMQTKVAISNI